MTVITMPSTGVGSDKVPLVDELDGPNQRQQGRNQSPPPSYHPKYLESGEAGLLENPTADDGKSLQGCKIFGCRLSRFTLIMSAIAIFCIFWYSYVYKSYQETVEYKRHLYADADAEDDATVPYKSYESYAAAENDMLSMRPSSPAVESDDYDAGQLNAMDGVYRKLENNALGNDNDDGIDNSAVENSSGGVISIIDEYSEVGTLKSNDNNNNNISVNHPLVISKSANFIHDFSINVTGIVDVDGHCCFVMPLMCSPSSISLYDLLFKMSRGYFSMDIKNIMGNMRVVKPAIKDLSDYGLYISKDCAGYSTFKLEKLDATAEI